MSDIVLFIISMVVITVGWAVIVMLRERVNPVTYFMSRTGLGVLKGVILAIAFAAIVSFAGSVWADESKWFKEAEVFAGIDHTFNTSPQCVVGGVDDRATSNLGLRLNVYEQDRFKINTKYTHHSCAFGEDSDGYDAIGIELIYKFWSR